MPPLPIRSVQEALLRSYETSETCDLITLDDASIDLPAIVMADVDSTLLHSTAKIIRTAAHPLGYKKLTPGEYAHEDITPETKVLYDFAEFSDPVAVRNGLADGLPLLENISFIRERRCEIGILTARVTQSAVAEGISDFLAKHGMEVSDHIYAINDAIHGFPNHLTDPQKKALVLKELGQRYNVIFIDDDMKNIRAALDLKMKTVQAYHAREGMPPVRVYHSEDV